MNNKNFQETISRLETRVDFLETELMNLDAVLIKVGFPGGIETLKETVHELLSENELSAL